MIKLKPPIENFKWNINTTQLYAVNRDFYVSSFATMKNGHNAIDIVIPSNNDFTGKRGYGTKVLAAHDWDNFELESDFPTKTRGNGLWLTKKLDAPITVLGQEAHFIGTCYWHLADFTIDSIKNKQGKQGDIIGLMGNTGFVYPKPNNTCPECPYYGTHLHFGVFYKDKDGKDIITEHDGYVDPVPHLFNEGDKLPVRFIRDLFLGSNGDDVAWLQSILKIEGFGEDYDTIGLFGPKTMSDVIRLQSRYGLTPQLGFVGSKTRAFINNKYSVYV